jgi:Tfp pilus assembly protein PilF
VSLINDVLRDLHAQPNGSEDEFDSAFEGLEAPPLRPVHSGEGRSILGRIVLGTFLGIMGLFVWESGGARELLLGSDQKRGTSHPSEAALIVLAPEPVVTPEPLATPQTVVVPEPAPALRDERPRSHVRGFVLDPGELRTRLTLDLSRAAMYSIESRPPGDQVHIRLADSLLTEPPPPTNLSWTPIQAMHARPIGNDLSIRLDLKTPVRTQSAMLLRQGSAALVLDLFPEFPLPMRPQPPVAASKMQETKPRFGRAASPPPAKIAPSIQRTPAAKKKRHEPTPSERAQRSYDYALELVGRGDAASALDPLKEALGYDPFHHPAREALASILVELGHADEASQVVAVGQRLQPDSTIFPKLRARILMSQGATAAALAALKRSAPSVEHDPEYHALMAALYQQERQYAFATGTYRQLLEVQPDKAVWWLGLGISLEGAGHAADALVAYRAAEALGGLGAESQRYLGGRISALEGGRR